MIVDAIQQNYPRFCFVAADLQTIRFSDRDKGLRYVYLTPRICQQALVMFDRGQKTREFQFTLRGAHTVAMVVTNRSAGTSVATRLSRVRHKLGRRRIIPGAPNQERLGKATVPDTIGGRAVPRPPSASAKREFGMRAFTADDLGCLNL